VTGTFDHPCAYRRDLTILLLCIANLHITTGGHGYSGLEHADHSSKFDMPRIGHWLTLPTVMNLSHVITEFSFGPYFPDITQPLDYSFEVAQDRECPRLSDTSIFKIDSS
jgi:hypothetical protein